MAVPTNWLMELCHDFELPATLKRNVNTPFERTDSINHRKCLLAESDLWQWQNRSFPPSPLRIERPLNPHLKSATHSCVLLPPSFSWSPLWSSWSFLQDNDASGSLWVKVKASWARAELGRCTNDHVWDLIRVSGGLSSSSSLAIIVGIASSAHESIWRLIATLQREPRWGWD